MVQQAKTLKNIMNPISRWKSSKGIRFILFFMIALLLYFAASDSLLTQTYDIEINSPSPKEIIATKQVENTLATERAREEASQKVQPVYTVVPMRNYELIDNIFNKFEQINADNQFTSDQKANIYRNHFTSEHEIFYGRIMNNGNFNDGLLEEMQKQLSAHEYRVPEEVFFKFPRLTQEDLESMKPVASSIINRIMADPVQNAQSARIQVAEMVNASDLSKQLNRELVQEIVRYAITPNRFLDEMATQLAREEASENVLPIIIERHDVVVRAGEVISEEKFLLLEELGLLKGKSDYWPEVGASVLIALLVFMLYMFIRQSEEPISTNNVQLVMLVLIYIVNIVVMKIVALGQNVEYSYLGYLAPVALGTMLITILLNFRVAFVSTIIFSIMSSIIFNIDHPEIIFDFRYGFVAAVVCFVSIFAIYRASQRATILKAGLLISLFASISIVALSFLGNDIVLSELLFSIAFAVAGGLLTAILVIGLLPFFEVSFGILSPLKLVELSNPNHPLLKKLLTETPGTYHHSVMVGNLSETAAEAIGANGLLCRVGSFYHDLGKTKRPSYFIENQGSIENPHDFIEPSLSKEIIVAHARDGGEMLREFKMPKQIIDIAEQHHGTTLLTYFYHKALKLEQENPTRDEPITEEEYRYPGPKAQTKEAAIVGIADCVEAAVRSLRNPTMEQIDSMVDKIIKNRLEDNQYNECDLTLKELDTVAKALKESLLGIFHSRIEYPDIPNNNQSKGESDE